MLNPDQFLDFVAERASAPQTAGNRSPRLAVVDDTYSGSDLPKVTFDGDNTKSIDGFPYVNSYSPKAGDRVVMLPVGNTYVIAGTVDGPARKTYFYEDSSLYYDVEAPMTVSGDLVMSPMNVPDPGYPYHLEMQGHFEFGSSATGTRWDMAITYLDPAAVEQTAGSAVCKEEATFTRIFGYASNLTGVTEIFVIANRIYGSANGLVTPFNARFWVKVIPA